MMGLNLALLALLLICVPVAMAKMDGVSKPDDLPQMAGVKAVAADPADPIHDHLRHWALAGGWIPRGGGLVMPISKEKMALYPGGSIRSPEWLAIRAFIRARAGDCCEKCGVKNYTIGWWEGDGFLTDDDVSPQVLGLYRLNNRGSFKIIKIVCTVAHLDCQLVDHSEANLAFLCQRCHNRHDAAARALNAAETRRYKTVQNEAEEQNGR